MGRKRYKPEEMVAKLRQVDVLTTSLAVRLDSIARRTARLRRRPMTKRR